VVKRKSRKKFLIEIKTNSSGWKVVELLEFRKNNKILIKLITGEVILRHRKKVRYGVTKRVGTLSGQHVTKSYPNIKKRRRKKKKNFRDIKKSTDSKKKSL
jgi:hypothetical protein